IVAGIDPRDGQFFVGKKSVFNKTPKLYKSEADIRKDLAGDLRTKMIVAFREFKKLGIKGDIQGDLLYTKSTLKKQNIDGQKYVVFHPNTIAYAVPWDTPLGQRIRRSEIGVVWHTTYEGSDFATMNATFGKAIASKMKSIASVWSTDATYR